MYNKKTCHNAETNMSPRKRQKKYKKNQILSVVMAIACTVVTPASDVALSMAFMTQNVYAENIQTTFPDGWNKDDKDDKKDDSTGGGEQEDKKPADTKPTDKKPIDTKNNGTSGSSNSGTKTDVSTGNSQGTKADLTGTTNGTAAAKTADMQKNVTYFVAAIVSGAVLLILADNRRKRKHGE